MVAAAVAVALSCASTQADVVMETVPVGNPGNANDTHGYGSVGHVYNIGKYEVTAGQYAEFLNAVADDDTYGLYNGSMWSSPWGCKIERTGSPDSYTYSVAGDWANRPVNYVSWYDTLRFANWMHNGQGGGDTENGSYDMTQDFTSPGSPVRNAGATWVLPSQDEWYKAAYHKNDGVTGNYLLYPTSSDSIPGYVNDSGNLSGTGTAFTEGGTDPGNYATYTGDGGTHGIGSPYYRTEVGEWENSDSPYGTFDQAGNVWEWNEAVVESARGLRGGSFYDGNDTVLRASNPYYDNPVNENYLNGFRLSAVPEPATLSGFALGGLLLVRRR